MRVLIMVRLSFYAWGFFRIHCIIFGVWIPHFHLVHSQVATVLPLPWGVYRLLWWPGEESHDSGDHEGSGEGFLGGR